jgi:hypothetical protein
MAGSSNTITGSNNNTNRGRGRGGSITDTSSRGSSKGGGRVAKAVSLEGLPSAARVASEEH